MCIVDLVCIVSAAMLTSPSTRPLVAQRLTVQASVNARSNRMTISAPPAQSSATESSTRRRSAGGCRRDDVQQGCSSLDIHHPLHQRQPMYITPLVMLKVLGRTQHQGTAVGKDPANVTRRLIPRAPLGNCSPRPATPVQTAIVQSHCGAGGGIYPAALSSLYLL